MRSTNPQLRVSNHVAIRNRKAVLDASTRPSRQRCACPGWERLGSTKFDVLVVGGGVTGSGAALDAATRGLSVAMVEARDFASGTSSRSSKLFHGGLRYLEQLNFGLVREALHERELMLTRIAPHLVKPVSFLYPLRHRFWERPYVGAGMTLYDAMSGLNRSVPHHRHFTRGGALRKVPALKRDGADRRADVLRRAGRRRPAHADGGADRRDLRRDDAQLRRGGEAEACRRAHRRAPASATSRPATRSTSRPRSSSTAPGSGPTTSRRWPVGRGRFHVRASKGVHIVVPRDRIIHLPGEPGLQIRRFT